MRIDFPCKNVIVPKYCIAKLSLKFLSCKMSPRAKVTLRAKESPCKSDPACKSVHSCKSDPACKRVAVQKCPLVQKWPFVQSVLVQNWRSCKSVARAKVTRSRLKNTLTVWNDILVNYCALLLIIMENISI